MKEAIKKLVFSLAVLFVLFGFSQKPESSNTEPLVSGKGDKAEMPETIIFGAVYNVFHERFDTDEEFFEKVNYDMEFIKSTGINTVMPFPLGQWDVHTKKRKWERSDYLIKSIEKENLMFMTMLQKSQHNAYFPAFQQALVKDVLVEKPLPTDDSDEIKFNLPEVKKSLDDYFRLIIERYGKSPALVGHNVWNEPHYESIDELTIPAYQQWLKSKYGTIDELNKSWAYSYSDWSEISPLARNTWPSSMSLIDWDMFRYWYLGKMVEWSAKTLRKYDRKHFLYVSPVMHRFNTYGNSKWLVDVQEIMPYTDAHSFSFYPDAYYDQKNDMPIGFWKYNSIFTTNRCDAGDKPYFLNEAQTNSRHGFGLSEYMTYDKLSLMTWLAFAENSKGIVYWKWAPFMRGTQSFGRGLTQTNGNLSKRGEAIKDIGAVIKKHGPLLYKAQMEKPKAAILMSMTGMQKTMEMLTKSDVGRASYFMNQSYEGTYKALWEENIPVDVVRSDRGLSLEDISDYKILYLPFQIMLSQEAAEVLEQYVFNGGWLVADAKTALMDDRDFGYEVSPGAGLDKVFGAYREDFIGKNGSFDVRFCKNEILDKSEFKKDSFKGMFYKDYLTTYEGTQTIATFTEDNMPALTVNKYGKGYAVLSAVPLGGSYINGMEGSGKIITDLALKAGADFNVSFSENYTHLTVKLHTIDRNVLAYVINTGDKDFIGNVNFQNILSKHLNSATDIISGSEVMVDSNTNSIKLNIELASHKTAVVLIK